MSTRWLKLTVAYEGTAYAGWQIQPDQPTVQGVLEHAWQVLTQQTVSLIAAGRTDAGVHALGQVVGVETATRLTNEDLHRGLNAVLPEDVAVIAVETACDGFHATHDAVSKRYRYQICNSRTPPVFDRRYVWHFPHALDTDAMYRAGQALVGRRDFASFESAGSARADTVRTIHELTVAHDALADRVTIDVAGDGFLYNMVRAIVGTLLEVGRGSRHEAWPAEVVAACDRRQAGQTVPPHGLFLVHVDYA